MGFFRNRDLRLLRVDLSGSEVLIGSVAMALGLCFIFEHQMFQIPVYHNFARMGFNAFWLGAVTCLSGTVSLVGVVAGRILWRRIALVLTISYWAFMSGFFIAFPTAGIVPLMSILFTIHTVVALFVLRLPDIPAGK